MKIWYALRWGFRALSAELLKLINMIFTDTFYLNGEAVRLWIETNPETLSLDSNNVQKLPLSVRFWSGEGSDKTALAAYLTLKIESVSGSTVTTLYTYTSASAVSTYNYTIPANSYGTANRISIYAYEDAARSKEIGSKQINIVVDNPTPFPRSENWATSLIFKNGEYLLLDDVIYMWMSRVPGNTSLSPKADLSSATPSGKWKAYPNWPLLATNIALIKFGLVGSAVFKDEYMYSQQGVDASGVATSDYRKFGTNDFTPNLMLNFLNGLLESSVHNGTLKLIPGRGIVIDGLYEEIFSLDTDFKTESVAGIVYSILNSRMKLIKAKKPIGSAVQGTEYTTSFNAEDIVVEDKGTSPTKTYKVVINPRGIFFYTNDVLTNSVLNQ